eukprot:832159-Pyramimonas_sp.AAC.1
MDQSDAGSTGIFSQWTNRTQDTSGTEAMKWSTWRGTAAAWINMCIPGRGVPREPQLPIGATRPPA